MPPPEVIRDLVVVLPGILGSTLALNGQMVWEISPGGVMRGIRQFAGKAPKLSLPTDIGDGHPKDGVEPVALMPDLHVLPGIWSAHIGYGQLLGWLGNKFHFVKAPPEDPSKIPNLL